MFVPFKSLEVPLKAPSSGHGAGHGEYRCEKQGQGDGAWGLWWGSPDYPELSDEVAVERRRTQAMEREKLRPWGWGSPRISGLGTDFWILCSGFCVLDFVFWILCSG